MIYTCETPGCENAGIPISITDFPPDPDVTVTRDAACGVCGLEITNIQEAS